MFNHVASHWMYLPQQAATSAVIEATGFQEGGLILAENVDLDNEENLDLH